MQKIPTLFQRDPDDRAHVLPVVSSGCDWVLAGEGVATRKYDGTCVMLDTDGSWWARREVKPGKAQPPNYVPVSTDEVTGKTVGWEPIGQSAFARFHAEALANRQQFVDESGAAVLPSLSVGTYELIGPKINGNPEGERAHWLIRHAEADVVSLPGRDFETLRTVVLQLAEVDGSEGIVFHHPDGRFAKIKARDFKAGA